MTRDEISVLVPTFSRPDALRGCLEALTLQRHRPAEVIVVIRPEDGGAQKIAGAFEGRLPLRLVVVERPGQVHALNFGLSHVRTSLVAITDDDARPHADWIERICEHFADATIGAVGGRDIVYWDGELLDGRTKLVGRVEWYGRVIGNHHLHGPAQDVQFLKGANMSYRRDALVGFDEHLAGDGAQACNDLQASLRVHISGWRVVWDPAVAVDHFPAERLDEDTRLNPTLRAAANQLHNQTYVLLSLLRGWRRVTAFLFAIIVGSRSAPGPVMLPLAILEPGSHESAWFAFRANLRGRFQGLATFIRTRGRPCVPADMTLTSHHHSVA